MHKRGLCRHAVSVRLSVMFVDHVRTNKHIFESQLSGKSGLKLFIVCCIFSSILDYVKIVHFIVVSDHALLHSYPDH